MLITGPAVPITPFAAAALFDRYESAFIVALVSVSFACAYPARALYRRGRDWGNYSGSDPEHG